MAREGTRLVLAAVDAVAAANGLSPGMTLARARAMVPDLAVCAADPDADAAALRRLAGWCLRYAPLVATDPLPGMAASGQNASGQNASGGADPHATRSHGILIDITGTAHLFGGEARLLRDLLGRLAGQGLTARAAVADTPGAAWAVARWGRDTGGIVPPGATAAALANLPIEALRLPASIADGLRLLGLERISHLLATPRAPLVHRFGRLLVTRLDQAHGTVFEPIVPLVPPDRIQARLAFAEPRLTAEALSAAITRLTDDVCDALERAGQGVRRLDLLFERVDGAIPTLRIGTARPSRDPRHLTRMLRERLERIDPGLGIEAMHLIVARADPLVPVQAVVPPMGKFRMGEGESDRDLGPLVDRLANRLGEGGVYRAEPVESDVPERSARRVSPLSPRSRTAWPADLPRPVRLLDPPQPIEAMALLPDHPPVAFTWRRVRHRVRHADGPERIAGEWWKRDGEMRSVRDYFRVEDEDGRRFWLFRRGDGANPETGDRRWFLHGFF